MAHMLENFLLLVKRCAKFESADDLMAFVELRNMSWDIPQDQQATMLHKKLKKTVHKKPGSVLYTLCAIEVLLHHGNAGLLEELMKSGNLHQLEEYFQPGRRSPKIEIQQLLARHIKVSSRLESALIPI